jgi:membrane associated rhomboid family serine protease
LLIPYQVDVPMSRWPVANFAIIGATVLAFLGEFAASEEALMPFVVGGWSPLGLLGHIWLHVGPIHLVGNMIFLWVFGNAVCAKLGNKVYPGVYIGLGVAAAVVYLLTSAGAEGMVGASGAINGVVGMFLVLYPTNEVTCFYLFFLRPGRFSTSSYWMILLWLAFDIWGAFSGGGGVAYWAHLGGFAFGVSLAVTLLKTGLLTMEPDEKSLLQVLGVKTPGDAPVRVGPDSAQTVVGPVPMAVPRQPAPDESPIPIGDDGRVPDFILRCSCGRELKVPRKYAAKRARCAQCGSEIRIPGG